ncbi:MAG TPA: GxxExxY protein [Nevskiaceae bacterium]|nr:GxxExxY protein [Nevskiaceae bacterium]
MDLNRLTHAVIGCAIKIHSDLGVGLLESAYCHALAFELDESGIPFKRGVRLPASYRGHDLGDAYTLDFLVAGTLILEIKAVSQLLPVHTAQLLTYLRLSRLPLGLLLNFHADSLRCGIKRVANAEMRPQATEVAHHPS